MKIVSNEKHYIQVWNNSITKWLILLFIEYSMAATNYQKLFLNIVYTHVGTRNITHCKAGQIFPNYIESINIFPEEAKTEPCYCVLHHRNITSKFIWRYKYYLHNNTAEKFPSNTMTAIEGCGPVYLSVINKRITLQYTGKRGAENVVLDEPTRILTDKEIGQKMLLCRNQPYDSNDLSSCDLSVASTSSQFREHETSTNMLMSKDSESQLKIIIPAVLIPLIIILLAIIVIYIYKKRQKNIDNSAIVSDTIEVRQAKGKNTHLKIHNYENVERPAVLEIVEQTVNETMKNHNYENVYKQHIKTESEQNGSIYSIVPPNKTAYFNQT